MSRRISVRQKEHQLNIKNKQATYLNALITSTKKQNTENYYSETLKKEYKALSITEQPQNIISKNNKKLHFMTKEQQDKTNTQNHNKIIRDSQAK